MMLNATIKKRRHPMRHEATAHQWIRSIGSVAASSGGAGRIHAHRQAGVRKQGQINQQGPVSELDRINSAPTAIIAGVANMRGSNAGWPAAPLLQAEQAANVAPPSEQRESQGRRAVAPQERIDCQSQRHRQQYDTQEIDGRRSGVHLRHQVRHGDGQRAQKGTLAMNIQRQPNCRRASRRGLDQGHGDAGNNSMMLMPGPLREIGDARQPVRLHP